VITEKSDAELIVAMSLFGKFGNSAPESARLRRDEGQQGSLLRFSVQADGPSGHSWVVGCGEEYSITNGGGPRFSLLR